MKKLCDWFNRYRDGMLAPEQQKQFESHIAICEECRTRVSILNRLASSVREQELPALTGQPEMVAARAYENCSSWDVQFLSWLRPAPAWSMLAALVVLLSLFWVLPSARPPGASGEYEELMIESDPAKLSGNAPQGETDDALVAWLEQGGSAK